MKLDNKDVHAVVKTKDGSLLAGTEFKGLYKTTDNGKNWKSVGFSSNNIYDMIADDGGRLYLGAKDGFYYSTDDGNSWVQQNKGMGINIVRTITKTQAGSIFAGTSSGIFRSIDFGLNWEEYSDGLEIQNKNIFSLNTGNDDIIYAGTANGIFKTQIADSYEEISKQNTDFIVSIISYKDRVIFKLNIEKRGIYSIVIYDIFGRTVDNLFTGYLFEGVCQFEWHPEHLNHGLYFYCIINENSVSQGKILFMP